MGCTQSRIDNEESVARCKERRNLMKEALIARNAFAAGHSGYAMALKNTGAALSDYGLGEAGTTDLFHQHQHQHQLPVEPSSQQPSITLPPPPPPLPNFSPSPLKRSITMPEIAISSKSGPRNDNARENTIMEDENRVDFMGKDVDDIDGDGNGNLRQRRRNGRNVAKGGGVREAPVLPPSPPPMTPVPPPPPDLKGGAWDYFFMVDNMPESGQSELDEIEDVRNENEDDETEVLNRNGGGIKNGEGDTDGIQFKTPEKVRDVDDLEVTPVKNPGKHIAHANTAPPELRRGNKVGNEVSLLKLLNEIDDHFLKASESAQEVSKMLEANRMHYHSNFADNRGHIDHSARVMKVITWNRSFKGVSSDGGRDDFDSEEYETHATVLDKLLAWEKKLYDEVKAGELMKLEYQRKVAMLNKQKKRGASVESLEKTKAAVSHLHTRYIVDMQSMDSTVSEVNHIRDCQLYPKLVALVDGMEKMWESMCSQHDSQLKIVEDFKSLDIAQSPQETTKHHHDRTIQLWNVVQEWHSQFEKLVTHQTQYIHFLNSWLRLNLVPIESSLKEKVSSPPRVHSPHIQALLFSWNDSLDKLPDGLAMSAISSFAAVIKAIIQHQEEEMRMKEKCEETRKEYLRKKQAYEEWHEKYVHRKAQQSETEQDDANSRDPVSERQFVVESLKKRLEEEVEAHERHCVQVREKSLGNLKTRLPELFRAMADYAHACHGTYRGLSSIALAQKQNSGSGS